MKIAIIGSRNIKNINLEEYVTDADEIVSGGARGVDTLAAEYAKQNGIKLTEFLPEYDRYGKGAPLVRNKQIVNYSDKIIAFWDGKSRGTKFALEYAEKKEKTVVLININDKQ